MITHHQPAAPGLAAGLAAHRPAGVQGANPAGDLDHLHLLDLADGDQHRRACSACRQDYLNVARVLNLSEWKVITKILLPCRVPYMLTGVRLAIGVAWLVIVAAEMLTGGVGIGFWVWDEVEQPERVHIIIAIFVIGIVGLLLNRR